MLSPPEIQFHPLERPFYARSPELVARELLGTLLIRRLGKQLLAGIVVETEAYLSQDDPGSHSFIGMRPRNRCMFGEPGKLYVYSIHAKYCLNAVTEAAGVGSAVLIRALEPVHSVEQMERHRKQQHELRLCRGPAMLCQSLAINLKQNGIDICSTEHLWFEAGIHQKPFAVQCGSRIGLSKAKDLALRFFVNGNRFVSGRASDHTMPRSGSLCWNRYS